MTLFTPVSFKSIRLNENYSSQSVFVAFFKTKIRFGSVLHYLRERIWFVRFSISYSVFIYKIIRILQQYIKRVISYVYIFELCKTSVEYYFKK